MSTAIRLTQTGGPNVLMVEPITQEPPAQGEVWIEQEAIGVKVLDLTQRNGSVPIPLPSGLGLEAAGRVGAVGPGTVVLLYGARAPWARSWFPGRSRWTPSSLAWSQRRPVSNARRPSAVTPSSSGVPCDLPAEVARHPRRAEGACGL